MKAAKVTADSGDVASVEPTANGAVLLAVMSAPAAVGAVRAATAVELDEVAAAALADMLVEARRSALQARAEAAMA